MSTTSKRDFGIKISGIPFFMGTFVGGDKTRTANKVWNGGASKPDIIKGPAENGEITIGAPFDPKRDRGILRRLRKEIETGKISTISKSDLDGDGVVVGKPIVYSGCILTSVSEPSADANSSDANMFELKYMPQSDS